MQQTKSARVRDPSAALDPGVGQALSVGARVDYVTVFDASQKWLDWTAPVFGALFVALGLRALVWKRGTPPYDERV